MHNISEFTFCVRGAARTLSAIDKMAIGYDARFDLAMLLVEWLAERGRVMPPYHVVKRLADAVDASRSAADIEALLNAAFATGEPAPWFEQEAPSFAAMFNGLSGRA